jgi:serine/threonine-protein kinase
VPSQIRYDVPPGFDAWFARACSREPAKRFQSATELATALANVCGVGRVRSASLPDENVQYMLKKSATPIESIPIPQPGMSPKTAMLAGLVLGVTMMVGIAGALAWREKEQTEEAKGRNAAVVDAGGRDGGR